MLFLMSCSSVPITPICLSCMSVLLCKPSNWDSMYRIRDWIAEETEPKFEFCAPRLPKVAPVDFGAFGGPTALSALSHAGSGGLKKAILFCFCSSFFLASSAKCRACCSLQP